MFDLKSFIKKGLLDAAGKTADHQIILIAAYWFDKHVLSEADMTDIETAIKPAVVADEFDDEDTMPLDFTYDYYDGNSDAPADYVSFR